MAAVKVTKRNCGLGVTVALLMCGAWLGMLLAGFPVSVRPGACIWPPRGCVRDTAAPAVGSVKLAVGSRSRRLVPDSRFVRLGVTDQTPECSSIAKFRHASGEHYGTRLCAAPP